MTWEASKRPAAALLPLSERLSPKTTRLLYGPAPAGALASAATKRAKAGSSRRREMRVMGCLSRADVRSAKVARGHESDNRADPLLPARKALSDGAARAALPTGRCLHFARRSWIESRSIACARCTRLPGPTGAAARRPDALALRRARRPRRAARRPSARARPRARRP